MYYMQSCNNPISILQYSSNLDILNAVIYGFVFSKEILHIVLNQLESVVRKKNSETKISEILYLNYA